MLAKRLLELSAEFASSDTDNATLESLGLPSGRSPEEIAEEYGQVMKEFLAS